MRRGRPIDELAGTATTDAEGALGRRHPLKRLALAFVSPDSYGMVLGLIVATYVTAVTVQGPRTSPLVVLMQTVTVWLALRTSKVRRSTRLVADVVLALAVLGVLGSTILAKEEAWSGLPVMSSLLYFIAPIAIIRHLVTRPAVDQEAILGALAAYLLIGMFFAFTYRSISLVQAGPFFGVDGDGAMPQFLFFSFTTLTTTGYGNLVPGANPGQSFAVAEMLIGQLFLIVTFGKIVSAWRPARWAAASATTTETAPPTEDRPSERS